MRPSTFGCDSRSASAPWSADPAAIGSEQAESAPVQGKRHARADLDLGHVEALADRDECPGDASVKIKQRVPAEWFDQPHRKLDFPIAAEGDAHMLWPDTERGRPRRCRLETLGQGELEAWRSKPYSVVLMHDLTGDQVHLRGAKKNGNEVIGRIGIDLHR